MCEVYVKQDGSFTQICNSKYGSNYCSEQVGLYESTMSQV